MKRIMITIIALLTLILIFSLQSTFAQLPTYADVYKATYYNAGEGLTGHYIDDNTSCDIVTNHVDCDSFGTVIAESNPAVGDRFKFTGRELNAGLGLYYFRSRF